MERLFLKNLLRKVLIIVFVFILALCLVLIADFFLIPLNFQKQQSIDFEVKAGDNLAKVLHNLELQGLELNSARFIFISKILFKSNLIHKGIYNLTVGETQYQLLNKLNNGEVKLVKFRIN